jgi:ADP-heptose:LPS heptosyltransferase
VILPRSISRVLLIRRKALGDSLVTMRAVLEVIRTWPDAAVDLVIDKPFAPLLDGLANRATRSGGFRVVAWPPAKGRSWLQILRHREYDLVIDWLGSPRTALWTALTGSPCRVGYDLPRRRWAYNVRVPRNQTGRRDLRGFAGEAFLDPLRSLGLAPEPWRDGYAAAGTAPGAPEDFSVDFRDWLDRWGQSQNHRIVMMMSATRSAKGWPARHAATLFRDFEKRGWNPVIVTGPGDEALETKLREILPPEALAPPTNLLELSRILERARVFVGTDCGPRHLAASLGVPTVTLFGPTDPVGWNPAGPVHVSVRTGVGCSPCGLTECPVAGHPCMTDLTPELVLESVDRVLGLGSH